MNGGSSGNGEGEQMVQRESKNEEEIIKAVYLTDYENDHLYTHSKFKRLIVIFLIFYCFTFTRLSASLPKIMYFLYLHFRLQENWETVNAYQVLVN